MTIDKELEERSKKLWEEKGLWLFKCPNCGKIIEDHSEDIIFYSWESDDSWGDEECCRKCFDETGDFIYLELV